MFALNTRLPIYFSVFAVLSLSGCTGLGLATGAGATAGIKSAQEGGLSSAVTDFSIQSHINSLWFQDNLEIFRKLDLTVKQGRVLVTGVVQDPQHRVDAIRLAWQPKGVQQVINEIRVAESAGFVSFARDTWISSQLRAKLIVDKKVQSINYTIDTVQGSVYLMGVAQNQEELNRVIDQARTISGVQQVVSYVKFAGQPLTEQNIDQPENSLSAQDPIDLGQGRVETKELKVARQTTPPVTYRHAQPEPYSPNQSNVLPEPGYWPDQPTGSAPQSTDAQVIIREPVESYSLNE